MPTNPSNDYLREAMTNTLAKQDACFNFMVQFKQENMSVEDPTQEWSNQVSPFITVGQVSIPKQQFDSPPQMNFCENLSYTPCHSLPEHKPLGVTNRVRKSVYELISKFRHEFNAVERKEPRDHSLN